MAKAICGFIKILTFFHIYDTIKLPNNLNTFLVMCAFLFLIKMHALSAYFARNISRLFGDNRAAFFVRRPRLTHFLIFWRTE